MPFRIIFLAMLMAAAPAQYAALQAADHSAAPKFDPAKGWVSLFSGKDLSGWKPLEPDAPSDWVTAAGVDLDPTDPKKLRILKKPAAVGDGAHPVTVNGPKGKTVNLLSGYEHGDAELYVEFLLSEGSNSGVYLQSLYEIQMRDNYGKTKLDDHDGGAIYGRRVDGEKLPGVPPRVNANAPAGEWQYYRIWFRAPRFDGAGKKTANARIEKVIHNGQVIHENVELEGPTQGKIQGPELPKRPLLIQGNHGPVAFRRFWMRPLR